MDNFLNIVYFKRELLNIFSEIKYFNVNRKKLWSCKIMLKCIILIVWYYNYIVNDLKFLIVI